MSDCCGEVLLSARRSFFPSPADGAIAGLDWPRDVRQKIAREETHEWHCAVRQHFEK